MNAQTSAPASEHPPVVQSLDFRPETIDSTKPLHRKIARLPKILRDRINAMLDESATYAEIISQLPQLTDSPLPYPISEMDVSRWKTTGYRRYIAEQERLDSMQANREAAIAMVANDDTITLPEATL